MNRRTNNLWYRAAQYDSAVECWLFVEKVKPLLKKYDWDDFSLGVWHPPTDSAYVVAMGFPTESTKKNIESLFEKPSASLPMPSLSFLWNETLRGREMKEIRDSWARHSIRKKKKKIKQGKKRKSI